MALALSARPAAAIVGASAESTANASSVVMVLNQDGRTAGFCTGIVVAPDVVMTAAHCVPKGADLRIHFPREAAEPVLLPVSAVVRHPGYRADAIKTRERSIDLALIRLNARLPDRFRPVTLAPSAGAPAGSRFVLSGYGVGREGDAASSGRLRTAVLTTRAPLSDLLLWSEDPSGGGAGACTGDSGGPVTAEGSLVISALIVWSAGRHGNRCGALTQSLWLAPQRPWIERTLQAWKVEPSL